MSLVQGQRSHRHRGARQRRHRVDHAAVAEATVRPSVLRVLWLSSAIGILLGGATAALQLAGRLDPFAVAMISSYAVLAILIVVLAEAADPRGRPHTSTGCARRRRPRSHRPCARPQRNDMR